MTLDPKKLAWAESWTPVCTGKNVDAAGVVLNEKRVPLRFEVGDDAGDDGGEFSLGFGRVQGVDRGGGHDRSDAWSRIRCVARGGGLRGGHGEAAQENQNRRGDKAEERGSNEGKLADLVREALAWLGWDEAVPRGHAASA